MRLSDSSETDGSDTVEPGGAALRRRLAVADLMADITGGGAALRVRVTGRSMAPLLNGGEVVIVAPTRPDRLRPGDLVLYRDARGLPVLHRIIRKKTTPGGGTVLVTKGDALAACDEPVDARRVLGKVVTLEGTDAEGNPRAVSFRSSWWRLRHRLLAAIHRWRAAPPSRRPCGKRAAA